MGVVGMWINKDCHQPQVGAKLPRWAMLWFERLEAESWLVPEQLHNGIRKALFDPIREPILQSCLLLGRDNGEVQPGTGPIVRPTNVGINLELAHCLRKLE